MELERLTIDRNPSYSDRPDDYSGRLKFRDTFGSVELVLDHQLSTDILKLVSESLTRVTKELANNLTASVFDQAGLPQIADQSNAQ